MGLSLPDDATLAATVAADEEERDEPIARRGSDALDDLRQVTLDPRAVNDPPGARRQFDDHAHEGLPAAVLRPLK